MTPKKRTKNKNAFVPCDKTTDFIEALEQLQEFIKKGNYTTIEECKKDQYFLYASEDEQAELLSIAAVWLDHQEYEKENLVEDIQDLSDQFPDEEELYGLPFTLIHKIFHLCAKKDKAELKLLAIRTELNKTQISKP